MGSFANQKALELINKAIGAVKDSDSDKLAKTLHTVLVAAGVNKTTADDICKKLPDDATVKKIIGNIYDKYLKDDKKIDSDELKEIVAELQKNL